MQCCGYAHGSCKTSQSVKIDKLTIMLIAAISDDIKNDSYRISGNAKTASTRSDMEIVEKQLEREREKLKRAKEAYLAGIDTAEEYRLNKESLTQEIDRLSKGLADMLPEEPTLDGFVPKPRIKEYKERCQRTLEIVQSPDIPETEKNAALKQLIEKAVYNKDLQEVSVFYI